jgi:hypothetical protein
MIEVEGREFGADLEVVAVPPCRMIAKVNWPGRG